MTVLLIDADSTIPNLPLMKLSWFHKNKGDAVSLKKLRIPYYPTRKKRHHYIDTCNYDKVYCSVIFPSSYKYIHGEDIIYGGSGYSLSSYLPDEIEYGEVDYSIYPECDYSIGFISRGCIRDCDFCIVRQKEGYLNQVNDLDDIIRHDKVRFLDNNILALPNHKNIFTELIDRGIACSFNEGLDIRLVDKDNSYLLSKLNYYPSNYIFAFDNIKYLNTIKKKLQLLSWAKNWQLKFYVYVHPNMKISDTVKRIEFLKSRKILPYVMRDISCWDSNNKDFYTDVAAWCNQAGFLKNFSFNEFLHKRHSNKSRIKKSKYLYYRDK